MNSLALTVSVAFVASLLLTAVVRNLARRWGVVDRPDGLRKLHGRAVPLWGGVAVYGASVLGLLAVRFGPAGASQDSPNSRRRGRSPPASSVLSAASTIVLGCLPA